MKVDGNNVTFETSGRRVYADAGFVALNSKLEIRQGSSGGMLEGSPYTFEEISELCDYMVAEWQRTKKYHGTRMNVAHPEDPKASRPAPHDASGELHIRPSIAEKKKEEMPKDL